jgi:putative flippase GtrA
MTIEQLSNIAGIVLSLLLAYVPAVSDWYSGKDSKQKAGIMAGLLAVAAVGVFGLSCLGWVADLGVACTQVSAFGLVKVFIAALIANQSTFLVAVRPFKG